MRIALVNDIAPVLEALTRIVMQVPGHEIAWIARNGLEAVERCRYDAPDLILMDLLMPVMDGVEATRRIMASSPCAILLVTSALNEKPGKVFEAMGHGAMDAVAPPSLEDTPEARDHEKAILKKIAMIRRLKPPAPQTREGGNPVPRDRDFPPLILIGSSTGGPKALAESLASLEKGTGVAVIVVQHVDTDFSKSLVAWLSRQTSLRVSMAEQGQRPEPGRIYVAGSHDHLVLTRNGAFGYVAGPEDTPFRPSVDIFFKSVADHGPKKGMAILLTGMGKDGAEGLALLRRAGWQTIAQDQETSAVYGMPKAARDLKAAGQILSIGKIALAIQAFAGRWGMGGVRGRA